MFLKRKDAFTLIEIIVVIGIIGILTALLLPAASKIRDKADEVVCISHLHNLWIAFSPCASDGLGWPQLPTNVMPGTLAEQQWWLTYSSNNLGLNKKDWMCPTVSRAISNAGSNDTVPLISYLPTLFDSKPGTAYKWTSMPWFSEMGNIHGHGNLTVLPDGSVIASKPMQQ